jgi:hypothetical protein
MEFVDRGPSFWAMGVFRQGPAYTEAIMQVTRSKIIALIIALGYVTIFVVTNGWHARALTSMCLVLSFPLAFIWFPEEIEERGKIAEERGSRYTATPAPVLVIVGWVFLLGYLPFIGFLLAH